MHPVHNRISDLVMRGVSPPCQHVGFRQRFRGQPMFWFFERREADAHARTKFAAQAVRDRAVHAVWIGASDRFVAALVNVFVPNRNAQLAARRHQIASASPVREMSTDSRRVADSTAADINAMVPRLSRPE